MNPERIPFDKLAGPSGEALLNEIAAHIRQGAVFVYPTETIYGIGGSTVVASVNGAIYEAKKRPSANPMIHLAGRSDIFRPLFDPAPPVAGYLAKMFWPGLLTIVVVADDNPEGTAIRVSDHPFISKLYGVIDFPIYSTSANLSGEPYNPDPDYIFSSFKGSIDFMIDAGQLPASPPSTIVKIISDSEIHMIREGVLKRADISSALDNLGLAVKFSVQ